MRMILAKRVTAKKTAVEEMDSQEDNHSLPSDDHFAVVKEAGSTRSLAATRGRLECPGPKLDNENGTTR